MNVKTFVEKLEISINELVYEANFPNSKILHGIDYIGLPYFELTTVVSTIGLDQWFLNFFRCDPFTGSVNTSRPNEVLFFFSTVRAV